MNRLGFPDSLQHRVRRAAAAANVREAIRDLTLHALCSRPLSTENIAIVVHSVGDGIAGSQDTAALAGRACLRGAWAGLEDAVGEALHAFEVAAREFGQGQSRLAPGESEELLREIDRVRQSLEGRWENGSKVPAALQVRFASVTAALRQPAPAPPAIAAADDGTGAKRVLEWVASGVLLGLSESQRRSAARG